MPFLSSIPLQQSADDGSIVDKRLIPNVIDELARTNPDAVFASIPRSNNVADGFRDVTYPDYANAINRAALWLENELGEGIRGEKIGYIAHSDLRYVILTVAAVKVGYQVRTLSSYTSGLVLTRSRCYSFPLATASKATCIS